MSQTEKEISSILKEKVASLPQRPGCYLFHDRDGKVIYVGKAKKLKNRVSSYFVQNRDHTPKVRVMVRQIADLQYVIVDSESDALLLENSLIKTHKPKYNILLKDDKTYPWIAITKEAFPRIISTRRVEKDGSEYFGPYGSITIQKTVLEFINELLPVRSCRLQLTEEGIRKKKFSSCLQYHIHNCMAPCLGLISTTTYAQYIDIARKVLLGNLSDVKKYLEQNMQEAASMLAFEEAHRWKQKLAALEKYKAHSVIVSSSLEDCDVFSVLRDGDDAYCNFLRLRHGSITAIQTFSLRSGIEENDAEIIVTCIEHVKDMTEEPPSKEIIVSALPSAELFPGHTFTLPQRGTKRDLLEFSLRSARLYRAERLKQMVMHNPERHTQQLMEAMQKELHLKKAPRHIECFDNSNLQGTNPVASCVVFRDGKPSKKEYRHFIIKTVVGADDFASMKEIIFRRYRRLIDEKKELPDLIIVDGGKGQLSSAYETLSELGIEDKVPIVGLAKRLEEIYYPFDSEPYYLSRLGEPLKVVCHIRDEAHRFGITFHRNRRSHNFMLGALDGIKGIGEKTRELLLSRLHSLNEIRQASIEELASIVGPSKAEKVFRALHDGAI
ncbi:MAG: excinuclease ABC subunit C [Alistipes sp.]|nr:excinuclease ABC subunit C [Candidatus Alistipes equi]